MNYFIPIIAYLSPLLLGLIIPFLLLYAPSSKKDIRTLIKIILVRITLPVIIIAVIVIGLHIISSSNQFHLTTVNFLYLMLFLWSWSLMIGGISYLCSIFNLNRNGMYVIIFILILLANTTVFYINPFIQAVNSDVIVRQWLIKLSIHINPILTIASNFFKHDLLRSNSLYSICDIGPYYFYTYASWITITIYYIIVGILAFGIAEIKRTRT
jgi:magnesium-transporting ATPase (P-type)